MFTSTILEATNISIAQIKILHEISVQFDLQKRQLIDLIITDKINEAEANLSIATKEFIFGTEQQENQE